MADDLGKLRTIAGAELICGCLLHIFGFDGFSPEKPGYGPLCQAFDWFFFL